MSAAVTNDEFVSDFPCLDGWDEADQMEAAAQAIDLERLCDTTPGALDPIELIAASERESALIWFGAPVVVAIVFALSMMWPLGFAS